MGWYSEVSKDISKIADAMDYYEAELTSARKEVQVSGLVERAAAQMPGIIEHRYSQLQEIEAILHFLNIELRKLRSATFRKFLETYQRALSSRDAEKYVDGEQAIVDQEMLINEFALMRNKWLGVLKALDAKGFAVNNVIKLRTAGLEDATL